MDLKKEMLCWTFESDCVIQSYRLYIPLLRSLHFHTKESYFHLLPHHCHRFRANYRSLQTLKLLISRSFSNLRASECLHLSPVVCLDANYDFSGAWRPILANSGSKMISGRFAKRYRVTSIPVARDIFFIKSNHVCFPLKQSRIQMRISTYLIMCECYSFFFTFEPFATFSLLHVLLCRSIAV